jgi:hypothetical protein
MKMKGEAIGLNWQGIPERNTGMTLRLSDTDCFVGLSFFLW